MEAPGSIFALNKAAQNGKFSKAITDKYENAGAAPYAGVSLVFLNLKQNQILRTNTEKTIRIIYQLMLQWNNRQSFPLAGTTVFSHIREHIEHELQTLSCENKELYRELNFIWQGIRMLDRKEASAVDKKRIRRREDYLQRERRKWDEKIQKNLTQIRRNSVQVPAELRPADVRKAILHQLLRTEIRETGIPGKETPGTGIPEAEPFSVFIYRDSFRELYRMLEHRQPDKTALEHRTSDKTALGNRIAWVELPLPGKTMQQPLPNETRKKTRQKQIPTGAQEAPAGIHEAPVGTQTVDRIFNRQINQQTDRQLQTEAPAQVITAILGEGITKVKLPAKETPRTGDRGAKPFGTENETRLRNLSEIFTGFIYRDSFRELYRMLEHRLPKTTMDHRLPTGVQEAPAGTGEISAGTQIENHIVNRQINPQINQQVNQQTNRKINQQTNQQIDQQINQQINRRINRQLLQIEVLPHRITEIREAEQSGAEIPGTEIPMTGIFGIDPLRTDAKTRLRSLGELFTGFIYHGSIRELHRKLDQRMPDKMREVQEAPAGMQEISAGIQTVSRTVNRQISQQVNQQIIRQIKQQTIQQINRQLPDKTMLEHRLPGETQKIIRQEQIAAGMQEAPAGIRETPAGVSETLAGIQTVNRTINRQMSHQTKQQISRQISQQVNRQISQQVNQQISQQAKQPIIQQLNRQLMQTEVLVGRVEENLFRQISVRDDAQRQFDIHKRDILTYQTLKTQAAASDQQLKYLAKERRTGKPSEQEVFLNPIRTELQYLKKKEAAGAEALREQKQSVKVLMEKVNIQEQVIEQMKNARQGQSSTFGKAEVKMVADTVLERLYKDIHLQRLRMGMS